MTDTFSDLLAARLAPQTTGKIHLHPHQNPPPGSWRWWLLVAGRGCVAAGTRIYDPVADEHVPVEEWGAGRHVLAATFGGTCITPATRSFLKGRASLYRVVLDSGRTATVTGEHKLRTPREWRTVETLAPGFQVLASVEDTTRTSWARVVAITPVGIGDFYDLTVPGPQNYLAEGFFHHNSGKSMAGAEYTRKFAQRYPGSSIGIMGPTLRDVRETCVLGPSGILRLDHNARWNDKRNAVIWPNGSIALGFGCYSPEDVERLRGNNFDYVWWDEFAAARYIDECFEMMDLALRQSGASRPHAIFTTTPKPKKKLRELLDSPDAVITRAATNDNPSLTEDQRQYMYRTYGGTRLGRQELLAEILDDVDGALWSHEMVQSARDSWPENLPEMLRIVVAIDPAVTSGESADDTGIIVAGRDFRGHGYILEDCTLKASPEGWASAAVNAYLRHGADRIIGEVNNGGDLVEHTLRSVAPNIPYRAVRASRGKRLRAEPVAALYERNLVHHAPGLSDMEEELVSWQPDGHGKSPNHLDAMVWAITELALTQDSMFDIDPEKHVMPIPTDVSKAHRVIEAWRFGWDQTTCIVWIAWTPGKPCFVIAEHEGMGEPKHHAQLVRTIRSIHKVNPDALSCIALPTKITDRNFAHEYSAHGVYIGENREGPSVDARRARLARELNRRTAQGPTIIISERCNKLQAQVRLMRFGDTKADQVPEKETGLADALALAVTLIPELEAPPPVDTVSFAREHGLGTPGVVGSIDSITQEQEIEAWADDYW